MVNALQVSDSYYVGTPANWKPGDDVAVFNKTADKDHHENLNKPGELDCPAWFLCLKKLPKDKALNP